MQELSQPGAPQQLVWQHGNCSHPRRVGQRDTGLCWGALLAGWESTQMPESQRVRWENLHEGDYNMREKWGCHNKLLSLGVWVNTSLEQMIQLTPELLPSPLQTHKKHYTFYLTLKGSSSPQPGLSVFLRKEKVKNGASKKSCISTAHSVCSSAALSCFQVSLESKEQSFSW